MLRSLSQIQRLVDVMMVELRILMCIRVIAILSFCGLQL
jgi:hypothetical protein